MLILLADTSSINRKRQEEKEETKPANVGIFNRKNYTRPQIRSIHTTRYTWTKQTRMSMHSVKLNNGSKIVLLSTKKKQQSKWNRLLWWHNMKMFWANTVKRMNILFATFCKLQFAFYDKSTNLLNNTLPPPPLSSVLLLLFCCRFHRRNTFPLFLRSLHDTHIHVIFVESLDVTLPLIAERNGYVIVCVLKSFLNGCYGIHVFFFSA